MVWFLKFFFKWILTQLYSSQRCACICFNLEAGHVYYQNYNWNQGHESFQRAIKISNLSFELTGVYGKRTKFQQKDVAQLLLKVNKEFLESNGHFVGVDKPIKWNYSNKDMKLKFLPKVFF